MKNELLERLRDEFLVLDGAMGTLLQEKGLSAEDLPEEWNFRRPEAVTEVHLEYLEAGAQIIETNTFGASPLKMALKGKESFVAEANRKGVDCVREAIRLFASRGGIITGRKDQGGVFVAGSMGPSGKMLQSDVSEEEAERSFGEQATLLAESGVDLFIVETMFDLREAELAVATVKRETALPVFASLVFTRTKKGEFRTLFGNAPIDCAKRLTDAGVAAVGANCGLVEDYIQVIREMGGVTSVPLVVYPNAGLPILKNGKTVFGQSPSELALRLDEEIAAGASIIGGCCGTTPGYIRLVSGRVKGKKRSV
jgi:5-methyltetrahydrofolate--homocysteine methyltransferase